MPFTFSHPAIVLPLKKFTGKTLSSTGLVIGSITPDFEYFFRMKVQSIYSHSLGGLFWFDLPLGLLLAFIYHQIVRDPFIINLPKTLNKKLSAFKYFDWLAYFKQNWIIVIISILMGAASHLFWDAFTHPTGYFVERVGWLNSSLFILKVHIQVFKILQHLSSLIGGVVIAIAIVRLKSESSDQSDDKTKYWLLIGFITIVTFIIRVFTSLDLHLYGGVIVTLISAFLISLILAPLLLSKPPFKQFS